MPGKPRQERDLHSNDQPLSLDDTPLDALGLSTRAYNCLRRAGLRTVAEVAALSDEQLLGIRNLGVLTLAEIREKLTLYLDSHPLPEQGRSSKLPPAPKLAAPTEPEPPSSAYSTAPSPVTRGLVPKDTPIRVLRLSARPHAATRTKCAIRRLSARLPAHKSGDRGHRWAVQACQVVAQAHPCNRSDIAGHRGANALHGHRGAD